MSFFQAVLLGLVQGLTEFLPVSSSGHLALFQNWFGLENTDKTLFSVLLHFATMIAVIVAFRKDIADMLKELWYLLPGRRREQGPTPARRLLLLIIAGTLPLVLAIFPPFRELAEKAMNMPYVIGLLLCATGLLLFVADHLPKGRKNEKNALISDALIVGVSQAVAVLPGLSRSGTTIATGLFRKFERPFAVRFSFLLSLPAVLGATLVELIGILKADPAVPPSAVAIPSVGVCIAGMLVAGVVGYFAIGLVRRLIGKGRFGGFAWYCFGMGLVAILVTVGGSIFK